MNLPGRKNSPGIGNLSPHRTPRPRLKSEPPDRESGGYARRAASIKELKTMLTNTHFKPSLRNCVRQSPNETQRRYMHQLYSLQAKAQRMGNDKVAAAITR